MKLLLIAYDFPPLLTPQGLRWFYLANGLAEQGVEVHVVAARFPDRHGFRGRLHPRVVLRRCGPGPFMGLSYKLVGRVAEGTLPHPDTVATAGATSTSLPSLSRRAIKAARRALDRLVFPDIRTEWFPSAWFTIRRLLRDNTYDLVISSHEPGVDLLLGLLAQRKGSLPWLVDLADPVVAPYTPRWRRPLDVRLERLVCRRADHILITAPELSDVLLARHDPVKQLHLEEKFTVITQGFDASNPAREASLSDETLLSPATDKPVFTLLFTGTFHPEFRDPGELVAALKLIPSADIHLTCIGKHDGFERLLQSLGDRGTGLGIIDHTRCLHLQKRAAVLINLGNRQSFQMPGKLFEYFGAKRPILHIAQTDQDPAIGLIRQLRRGVVVPNKRDQIKLAIVRLHELWRSGRLENEFDLSMESVMPYSWSVQAAKVLAVCERISAARPGK